LVSKSSTRKDPRVSRLVMRPGLCCCIVSGVVLLISLGLIIPGQYLLAQPILDGELPYWYQVDTCKTDNTMTTDLGTFDIYQASATDAETSTGVCTGSAELDIRMAMEETDTRA